MQKSGIILAAIIVMISAQPAMAENKHSFGGLVAVEQKLEALSNIVVGLWGTLTIDADGQVTGGGIIRYEGVTPCKWTPPAPENGAPPHCQVKNLFDGEFSIVGSTFNNRSSIYHRQVLSEMVAGTNTQTTKEIDANEPIPLQLELKMDVAPKEILDIWGLSDGSTKTRETNVAQGGLLVSTLFDGPFVIGLNDKAQVPTRHEFQGFYTGAWPISAGGAVYFMDIPPEKLPKETDYQVFLNAGVEALFNKSSTPFQVLDNEMIELIEQLHNSMDDSSMGSMPNTGLNDDTRANSGASGTDTDFNYIGSD